MNEKIGVERPPVGYFSKVRVHHTERVKPQLKEHILPEPMPEPPDPNKTEVKTKIYPKYYHL